MKQFLIPSGQIDFRGNPIQLKQRIKDLGGIHFGERLFNCQFRWPRNRGIYISLFGLNYIRFEFRCVYRSVGTHTEISYEVFPHSSCYLALVFPIPIILYFFYALQKSGGIPSSFFLFFLIFAVYYLLFFIARNKCIQQFLESFGN